MAEAVKTMYLIRRRPGTTREELVAHWFANHMPAVVRMQPRRYLATVFDAADAAPWDGVAQLWWDQPIPKPEVPHGTEPTDAFQQKAEPYVPWATREYVILDGSERLASAPNTLNAPYPITRSGFCKATFLVRTQPDTDFEQFFAHWLEVHSANVRETMAKVDGFRYVVSQSLEPETEHYAGMAELYFPDAAAWSRFMEQLSADGIEQWLDTENMVVMTAHTEMVGVP